MLFTNYGIALSDLLFSRVARIFWNYFYFAPGMRCNWSGKNGATLLIRAAKSKTKLYLISRVSAPALFPRAFLSPFACAVFGRPQELHKFWFCATDKRKLRYSNKEVLPEFTDSPLLSF